MIKSINLIFIICAIFYNTKAQTSYISCKILDNIGKDINQQYSINKFLKNYKDSIFMTESPSGELIFNNHSSISNKEVYLKIGDTTKLDFFESPVFKMPNGVVILDTLGFFISCQRNRSKKSKIPTYVRVTTKKSILSKSYSKESILVLKSLHIYKNSLVFTFTSIDSRAFLLYFFSISAEGVRYNYKKEIDPVSHE